MKKKLDTRFPAARIKKIMQADEDVGKIALAVPVLVSKALELFLQDLCDRTYEITLQRGAKTLNSVHLKHCVHTFSVFDFLKDVVSKVPDYSSHGYSGDPAAAAAVEMSRRRKASEEYGNESDEESKRSRMLTFNQQQQQVPSPRGRGRGGRGRGRGRGRSRGSGAADRGDMMIINPHHPETEQFGLPAISLQLPNPSSSAHPDLTTTTTTTNNNNNNNVPESREPPLVPTQESNYATDDGGASTAVAGLGVGQDVILNTESIETQSNVAAAAAISVRTASAVGDQKDGECAADWPLSEVDHMAIDHLQLAHHLTHQMGEDEEDYDDEEEEKD